MSRALDDLDPRFRPLAVELLARLTEAGILVLIVGTGRTAEEQADAVRRGVSWTSHSKHQDGLAIDLCPYETYALHGDDKLQWDAGDPIWQKIGAIGVALGLKWGVTLHGEHIDLGHFEYVEPQVADATGVPV